MDITQFEKKLIEAYKSTFTEFKAKYDEVEKAKANRERVYAHYQHEKERYIGERAAKQANADAALNEAKLEFNAYNNTAWNAYKNAVYNIGKEVTEYILTHSDISADAIDPNGMEILKSGVCSGADFMELTEKYANNPTMLKMVNKYATEARDNTTDARERATLNVALERAKDSRTAAQEEWESFTVTMKYFTDEYGRTADHIIHMGAQFDELIGNKFV